MCTIPNPSYAYKYKGKWTWSPKSEGDTLLPMYCCCALHGVCGCDDVKDSRDFVTTLLNYLLVFSVPDIVNNSHVCSANIGGGQAIIVNGTLVNGSTKADPSIKPATVTYSYTTTEYCQPTDTNQIHTSNGPALSVSEQMAVMEWAAATLLGTLLGASLIFL